MIEKKQETGDRTIRNDKVVVALAIYDLIVVNLAYFVALWLRYDGRVSVIPDRFLSAWLFFIPAYSVICLAVFMYFRLYRSIWRYASFSELKRVLYSTIITAVAHGVLSTVLFCRMPLSYHIVGAGLQFIAVLGVRFSYRFVLLERSARGKNTREARASRVMLIGAGSAGRMLLRDTLHDEQHKNRVCCIIDDNKKKWGRDIDGVPVVGGRDDILLNVEKYKIEKIVVAMPSVSANVRRDILDICKETGCELKNLPGMQQLVNGEVSFGALRDVAVEDLLGREPIHVDMEEIYDSLSGKVILVTGGGGSIGSELCRQIARHNPKQLIIFDIYENNAHAIQLELQDNFPELDLVVLIGSVRDSRRINQVFADYQPDLVYHAAAHKHVPLMEDSPCESIKNNAIGTYKTAYAALMNGCSRFVLISTDKAVNPTNIMGASKRLCEMVIQCFAHLVNTGRALSLPEFHVHAEDELGSMEGMNRAKEQPKTEFVAVRFGNVLGSNGSVIPRFKEQIAKGGPVTVTHPDIIRYFMTIPEAACLVLQAGTYAKGGEIFVLDMGEPVKIDTLARNLIKLSGLRPDEDIEIVYTGLRKGEKLFEEKLMNEEGMKTTPNKLIHIGKPIPFDTEEFLVQLRELMEVAYREDEPALRRLVEQVVPTYHPADNGGAHYVPAKVKQ